MVKVAVRPIAGVRARVALNRKFKGNYKVIDYKSLNESIFFYVLYCIVDYIQMLNFYI